MAENININVSTPNVNISGGAPNVSIATPQVSVDASAATTNVEISVGGQPIVETSTSELTVEIELTSPQVTVTTLNQPPNGVQQIIPGINTTVSPASGIGIVAVNSTGGISNVSVASPLSTALFFNFPTTTPQLTIQNATNVLTQYLRADGIWSVPPGSSAGTVSSITAGVGLGAPATGNSITTNGTINLLAPTSTVIGGVKAGTNTSIALDGTISVLPPTATVIGGVKAGTNITIALDGTISSTGGSSGGGGTSWTAPANIAVGDIVFAASPIAVQPGATQVFNGLAGGGGVIWSEKVLSIDTLSFTRVGFGLNFWLALAPGISSGFTSPDGNIWTLRSLQTPAQWSGIAANATIMILMNPGGTSYVTTTNGIVFNIVTRLPVISNWGPIIFANGIFLVVSTTTGTRVAASSVDGQVWTQRTLSIAGSWTQLAFGAGLFLTVSNNSANASTSPDGITWTTRTLPISSSWTGLAFTNGLFVLTAGGSALYTSPDAINWTLRALPNGLFFNSGTSLAAGNNSFVILNSDDSTVYTSSDGITWVQRIMPSQANWDGIGFGNNAFIAVGNGGLPFGSLAAKSPALNALYAFPTATISDPTPCVAGTYKLLGGNQQFIGATDGLWVRTA